MKSNICALSLLLVGFLSFSTLTMAGGSVGGGGGAIALQIESFSGQPMITREEFSALVLSGAQDATVTINRLPAKVLAVNFQSKTVELEILGAEESTVLQAVEAEPKQ